MLQKLKDQIVYAHSASRIEMCGFVVLKDVKSFLPSENIADDPEKLF